MLCCFFHFVSNHCVCRNRPTLQIGNTHEYTVRRQICCLSRASGVIVVVSGRSMVSVVFRLVRPGLFCSSGFWLRVCSSHVSGWQTSVGRGNCVVPWGAGRLFPRGYRGRRVMRARLVFWVSGASGMGAFALDMKSTFFVFFKISARPC